MAKREAGLIGAFLSIMSVFAIVEGVKIWAEETPKLVESFEKAGQQIQANGDPASVILAFIPPILILVLLGIRLRRKL